MTRLRDRLAAALPAARTRVLVDFILQQIRDELEVPVDQLHPRSRFENLGIDSKRALEFKELLDEQLGIMLPTTLMFDHPTPEALAAYVVRAAFGDPAAPPPAPSVAEPSQPAEAESAEEQLRRKLASYDA